MKAFDIKLESNWKICTNGFFTLCDVFKRFSEVEKRNVKRVRNP